VTHASSHSAARPGDDSLIRARHILGSLELTVCTDGTFLLDGGAMFGVVPKTLWSRRAPADANNNILLGLNALVLRLESALVIIETGLGNKLSPKLREIHQNHELLPASLAAAGIRPEDVTHVLNTHLHFDHCGWNTIRKDGKIVPTFPRAKYYAPEGEWQYARKPSERDAISYIPENYDPLVQSGQMTLLKGGEEIVPGISVKTFPGHTAHMQAVIVVSGGRTACYISDLIPTTAHIDITWGMSFDLYPLQTIESKKQYYAKAIPEKWLTVFTHDPATPWAYVEKDEIGKMAARKV
jgi:glyoxylase-like metal-dependent hydrolase (beta-lactamase superfamily II)